jgi:hypothetical protein
VLAKPPNSVSAVSARRYDEPKCWESVANAGSYSVRPIARPPTPQASQYSSTEVTRASQNSATAAATEPMLITIRPP